MKKEIFWCTTCLNMSTRPRIQFDENGRCNACVWSEKKKTFDWDSRLKELNVLLDKHRRTDGRFDCVVPVSGGKDGSYVAYQLKHKYNMNPLCVTVRPALELPLGDTNLRNFINSGFDHIHVSADVDSLRAINKMGFIEKGFPYYGWLTAIATSPLKIAHQLGINLVFYGEDGEVEYGGSSETNQKPTYSIEYMKRVYLEGGYDAILDRAREQNLSTYFFRFPEETAESQLEVAHWSYFENWDSYRNYLVAKEHCGLQEAEENNSGTFTNFAQNDQALYSLHAYMMYLKFGFGRATQDAGIEIRRGAMSRDQAVNLVRLYDGHYPEEFIDTYLEYYQMTQEEFDAVLDKWVNKELFEKVDGHWEPVFQVE